MTSLAFNVNQSVGLSTPQPTEIQELTLDEIEEVSGAIGPAVYGAIHLGRLAAPHVIRHAPSVARSAGKWFSAGFFGAGGVRAFEFVADAWDSWW